MDAVLRKSMAAAETDFEAVTREWQTYIEHLSSNLTHRIVSELKAIVASVDSIRPLMSRFESTREELTQIKSARAARSDAMDAYKRFAKHAHRLASDIKFARVALEHVRHNRDLETPKSAEYVELDTELKEKEIALKAVQLKYDALLSSPELRSNRLELQRGANLFPEVLLTYPDLEPLVSRLHLRLGLVCASNDPLFVRFVSTVQRRRV
jgi:hypothetical protein